MPHTIHGSTGYIPTIYIVDFFMVWKRRYLNIQPASHFFILCSLGLFQGRIYYQLFPCDERGKQTRLPHDEACFYWSHLTFGEAYTKMKPPATAGRFSAWPRGQDRKDSCPKNPQPMRLVDLPTWMVRCCFLHRKNVGKYTMHGWSWMVWAWERNKRWKKRPGKHSVSFFWPL